jgi:hypothetical protein
VFRRVRERGVLAAFATARPRIEMTADYQALINIDGLALNSGATIIIGGKIVRQYSFPVELY